MESNSNNDTQVYQEKTKRFWILRLMTEVRADGVYVRLSPIQRSFRRIPFTKIEDIRVTAYSAKTYGGWHWGLRSSPRGNTVYRLHGNQGVELTLTNGRKFFIGSQTPEQLSREIMQG